MPEPPQQSPLLELLHVSHHYPGRSGPYRRAVDDVTLEVGADEVVCLLGPSGCGKSTLLRLAAGLEPLQQGVIRLRGRTVADPAAGVRVAAEARGVGLVFQDSALFPHLSVLDNVAFGLAQRPRAERRRRARELLALLGMESYAATYPHTLSGGQQQRVALARALAPAPAVVLLDEPFASLDAALRSRVREDTRAVLKASGTATLLVTHDPEEALYMADRIALLRAGRIEQLDTPAGMYCRPATPFVARFFGEANELAGVVESGRVTTPVGPVAAPGRADGERVCVLVRPEALRLDSGSDAGGAVCGRVVAAHLLGRYSALELALPDGRGGELGLRVHVHGVVLPAPGQPVALTLDPSQVFVFPAAPASGP